LDVKPKQRRFVAEYLMDESVTRAAQRVGVRPATARAWMKKDDVRAAIEAGQEALLDKAQMGADEVVERLSTLARTDVRMFAKAGDVVKALELLGKRHKLFTDNVDMTSGGEALTVNFIVNGVKR
jgi:phage terminase small subunit